MVHCIEIIRNHHLPEISKKENDIVNFYLRLLRDADKLDLWKATTDSLVNNMKRSLLAIELGLNDKTVATESYCRKILEGGITGKNGIDTFSDYLLYQMSWAYDLNFRKSFQFLNQKQYMSHYYEALPKNDHVYEIYRKIKIQVENQLI